MQRREFITVLGGAAATWPLAALAQQPDHMRRIGVLMAHAESDPEFQAYVTAFREGFRSSGGRPNSIPSSRRRRASQMAD